MKYSTSTATAAGAVTRPAEVIDLEQYRLAKAVGWACFSPEQIVERNEAIRRFSTFRLEHGQVKR